MSSFMSSFVSGECGVTHCLRYLGGSKEENGENVEGKVRSKEISKE